MAALLSEYYFLQEGKDYTRGSVETVNILLKTPLKPTEEKNEMLKTLWKKLKNAEDSFLFFWFPV